MTRTCACSTCRSASRTASACSRDVADVLYKQTAYYDPAVERGIAWNDPDVAIAWPAEIEPVVSARDAAAPALREVADELPFVYHD